jgi:DNA-binding HxlR family transcriptional regulator
MQKDVLRSLETLSVLKALCQGDGRGLEKPSLSAPGRIRRGDERSFSELKRETGLAGATLAQRLKILEREGYVEREVARSWPPRTFYRITEKGRELYSQLVEEKLKPEIEEYIERFPEEVYSLVRRYLKLEP